MNSSYGPGLILTLLVQESQQLLCLRVALRLHHEGRKAAFSSAHDLSQPCVKGDVRSDFEGVVPLSSFYQPKNGIARLTDCFCSLTGVGSRALQSGHPGFALGTSEQAVPFQPSRTAVMP